MKSRSLPATLVDSLALGGIALAALAVYHNSFSGAFVFDDRTTILENTTIRHFRPIRDLLMPPVPGVDGRPLVNISLAVVAAYCLCQELLSAAVSPVFRSRLLRGAVPAVALFVVAAGLGSATVRRNEEYRSEMAIFQDAIEKSPNNPLAHFAVGAVLQRLGKYGEAIPHFQRALELKPDYYQARHNLGVAYRHAGMPLEAIRHYEMALRLNPHDARTHSSLASALIDAGRAQQAAAMRSGGICPSPSSLTMMSAFWAKAAL